MRICHEKGLAGSGQGLNSNGFINQARGLGHPESPEVVPLQIHLATVKRVD